MPSIVCRNTHEYYGFSAGLDFESKIIISKTHPASLSNKLLNKNWNAVPIMLSATPIVINLRKKKKLEITRSMLKVMVKYRHPVSIISKNGLVLRDLEFAPGPGFRKPGSRFISITPS